MMELRKSPRVSSLYLYNKCGHVYSDHQGLVRQFTELRRTRSTGHIGGGEELAVQAQDIFQDICLVGITLPNARLQ